MARLCLPDGPTGIAPVTIITARTRFTLTAAAFRRRHPLPACVKHGVAFCDMCSWVTRAPRCPDCTTILHDRRRTRCPACDAAIVTRTLAPA